MLTVGRRQKYSNMGARANVNKSGTYVDINFDLEALNLMCGYIVSENSNIRRSHLINMRNLFSMLNPEVYRIDEQKKIRFDFVVRGLEARLEENLKDPYMIIKHINGGIINKDIIDPENLKFKLSNNEMDWINKTVSNSLKYSYLFQDIKDMQDLVTEFMASDYGDKSGIAEKHEAYVKRAMTRLRHSRVEDRSEAMFSLRDDFDDNVRDIHAELSAPSSILYTGMQGFNELIGGGLYGGRTYMLFGLSGGGKSITLLQLAYQLKKYNKHLKTKDPTKVPCIVILTQENTVKETVERLFDMSVPGSDDIRNYDPEEIIRLLQQEGELYLSEDSPIDIILKFKPSKSVDTSYMYELVEDLEEDGYECICFIHDYVKHIRAAYPQADVRLELGQVCMEYKTFASLKDIPLISVSQLNRDGAKTVDAAAENNKADLTRLLGRSNVGESMLMIENLDFAGILNIENDYDGNLYMVFKRMKIRYKATKRDYICQPFLQGSTIRLIEDAHLAIPVFKESLKAPKQQELENSSNRRIVTARGRQDIEDILADKDGRTMDSNVYDIKQKTVLPQSNTANKFFNKYEDKSNDMYCPFTIEKRDIA